MLRYEMAISSVHLSKGLLVLTVGWALTLASPCPSTISIFSTTILASYCVLKQRAHKYTTWKIIWNTHQLQVASILEVHRRQQGESLALREGLCWMGEPLSSPWSHFLLLSSPLLPLFINTFLVLFLPTSFYLVHTFCFLCFTAPPIWASGLLFENSNFWNLPEHVCKERWRRAQRGVSMEACEPLKLSLRALSKKQGLSLTLPSFPPLFPSPLSFLPRSLCPHSPSALSSLSLLIRQFSPLSPFFSRTRSPLLFLVSHPHHLVSPTTASGPAPPSRSFLSHPPFPAGSPEQARWDN